MLILQFITVCGLTMQLLFSHIEKKKSNFSTAVSLLIIAITTHSCFSQELRQT